MEFWRSTLADFDAAARRRLRLSGLAVALLAALLVAWLGPSLRQPLTDVYQRVLPAPAAGPRVRVVLIDADSLAAIGGWPWTRYVTARLTEQIAGRGAAAIGFDMLFAEPDRQAPEAFAALYPELPPAAAAEVAALPSMDDVFAAVVGRSPVVLARAGVDAGSYDSRPASRREAALPPDVTFSGPQPAAIPSYPDVVTNLPVLENAALGHGLLNGAADADGVIRRVPLLGRAQGVLTPSFALDLVRVAEGEEQIRLEGGKDGLTAVRVGRHRVPADAGGRMALRFAGPPPDAAGAQTDYRTISAADLLRTGVPADAFKDAIVLVGLGAAGTSDVVTTARDPQTYGVFVQAQAVDAILRSSALDRPGWIVVAEWAAALVVVVAVLLAVPGASMGAVGLGIAALALVGFGGSAVAFQSNVVFDPFPVMLPGAAAAAAMVAMLVGEGRRIQGRLRVALDDERLSSARVSGELAAANQIQHGLVVPRETLQRLHPALEIDAILQPARSIGGDLYDAFMIDRDHLCFLLGDVSGKGVPAALFMALSQAQARAQLKRPGQAMEALGDAVAAINNELSQNNAQDMFLTLVAGVLNVEDGVLQLCRAGHEKPILVRRDGSADFLDVAGGPSLCIMDDIPYVSSRHRLASGETLIMYTDGLSEAAAPDGETLFGREHLLHVAARACAATGDLRAALDSVVAEVRRFEAGSEPTDDVAVLALRRR